MARVPIEEGYFRVPTDPIRLVDGRVAVVTGAGREVFRTWMVATGIMRSRVRRPRHPMGESNT